MNFLDQIFLKVRALQTDGQADRYTGSYGWEHYHAPFTGRNWPNQWTNQVPYHTYIV